MTALELTVHPKQPSRPGPGTGWADWRRDQDRECKLAHDKRFSDAELAAEYWQERDHVHCLFRNDPEELPDLITTIRRAAAIEHTLHRFAVAPHYYEETE